MGKGTQSREMEGKGAIPPVGGESQFRSVPEKGVTKTPLFNRIEDRHCEFPLPSSLPAQIVQLESFRGRVLGITGYADDKMCVALLLCSELLNFHRVRELGHSLLPRWRVH